MIGHKTSHCKFKKTAIIPNIWSQWYEITVQQQEDSWKIHKYVKIKQHTSEQPMGQRIIRAIKKYPETNENKNTTYQKLQDVAKAVLEGNL